MQEMKEPAKLILERGTEGDTEGCVPFPACSVPVNDRLRTQTLGHACHSLLQSPQDVPTILCAEPSELHPEYRSSPPCLLPLAHRSSISALSPLCQVALALCCPRSPAGMSHTCCPLLTMLAHHTGASSMLALLLLAKAGGQRLENGALMQ